MRLRVAIVVVSLLGLAACAVPLPPPPGVLAARSPSPAWWLCDPPGLWEDPGSAVLDAQPD
jgi:hypothetical protein